VMTDKAKLARDTYREPEMAKRCGNCRHYLVTAFELGCFQEIECALVGDVGEDGPDTYGLCDAWDSDDG